MEVTLQEAIWKMSTLDKALLIAVQAHQGQKDRYGQPFILHPLRMMMRADSEAEKTVAVLHDVVEKSDWTLEELRREGFSERIIDAVDCLTKRAGESYEDHIERAKTDELARAVKLADLEDNMNPRRIVDFSEDDGERIGRFHKSWSALRNQG